MEQRPVDLSRVNAIKKMGKEIVFQTLRNSRVLSLSLPLSVSTSSLWYYSSRIEFRRFSNCREWNQRPENYNHGRQKEEVQKLQREEKNCNIRTKWKKEWKTKVGLWNSCWIYGISSCVQCARFFEYFFFMNRFIAIFFVQQFVWCDKVHKFAAGHCNVRSK